MEIAGYEISAGIDIVGILSNTWVWILIVSFIGVILIVTVVLILFYTTFKRKVVIFEERSGQLEPVKRTRARVIRLRAGGEELMKTFMGGYFLSAYGQKVGRNSYWYMRGPDGYLYNFVLDKFGKPVFVSGDMRMFNIAIDRLSQQTYGKASFLEKYGVHIMLFFFLMALIGGMWIIIGKIADVTSPLAQSVEIANDLAQTNNDIILRLDSVLRSMGKLPTPVNNSSGLVPA